MNERDTHDTGGERLAALRDIGTAVASGGAVESAAQAVIAVLERDLGYEFGAVLLADPDTRRLVPLALSDQGHGPSFIEEDKAYVASQNVALDIGVCGWTARTGEAALVPDVRRDDRYFTMREEVRSELCVPIRVGDRTIGVLNVESPAPAAFGIDDQQVLEAVAPHLAIAWQADALPPADGADLTALPNLADLAASAHDEALPALRALARLADAVAKSYVLLAESPTPSVHLERLVRSQCSRFAQVAAQGATVTVAPPQLEALAIVLRELASAGRSEEAEPDALIEVSWLVSRPAAVHECRVRLAWQEADPLATAAPAARGMIEEIVTSTLRGEVHWSDSIGGNLHHFVLWLDESATP